MQLPGENSKSVSLFTKQTSVLPQDLVKSRSHDIGCYIDRVVLKLNRHLGGATVEVPIQFWGDWKSRISRLRYFTTSCGKTCVRLVNRGTGVWFEIRRNNHIHNPSEIQHQLEFCIISFIIRFLFNQLIPLNVCRRIDSHDAVRCAKFCRMK